MKYIEVGFSFHKCPSRHPPYLSCGSEIGALIHGIGKFWWILIGIQIGVWMEIHVILTNWNWNQIITLSSILGINISIHFIITKYWTTILVKKYFDFWNVRDLIKKSIRLPRSIKKNISKQEHSLDISSHIPCITKVICDLSPFLNQK